MSLVWLLRLAKTYDQKYNLVKAIYDIQPNYGELVNMRDYMITDEDWKMYDEVQEMLKSFQSKQ
jgi:hypothetical protein